MDGHGTEYMRGPEADVTLDLRSETRDGRRNLQRALDEARRAVAEAFAPHRAAMNALEAECEAAMGEASSAPDKLAAWERCSAKVPVLRRECLVALGIATSTNAGIGEAVCMPFVPERVRHARPPATLGGHDARTKAVTAVARELGGVKRQVSDWLPCIEEQRRLKKLVLAVERHSGLYCKWLEEQRGPERRAREAFEAAGMDFDAVDWNARAVKIDF